MIRALSLSLLGGVPLLLFQSFDIATLAEKFGIPFAFTILLFLYFTREIRSQRKETNDYRQDTIDELKTQTTYLRTLVDDRLVTVCKFAENEIKKREVKGL